MTKEEQRNGEREEGVEEKERGTARERERDGKRRGKREGTLQNTSEIKCREAKVNLYVLRHLCITVQCAVCSVHHFERNSTSLLWLLFSLLVSMFASDFFYVWLQIQCSDEHCIIFISVFFD